MSASGSGQQGLIRESSMYASLLFLFFSFIGFWLWSCLFAYCTSICSFDMLCAHVCYVTGQRWDKRRRDRCCIRREQGPFSAFIIHRFFCSSSSLPPHILGVCFSDALTDLYTLLGLQSTGW